MSAKYTFRFLPLLFMLAPLILSSCAPLVHPSMAQPLISPTASPTQAVEVDEPNVFADPSYFLPALLKALEAHDTSNLSLWMTDPLLTGTWRVGKEQVSPNQALKTLYTD
jgi:hypothetical protein